MRLSLRVFIKVSISVVFNICLVVSSVHANDFIVADLRDDYSFVYNSGDYRVGIAALGIPGGSYSGSYTTGWLSINLDDEPGLYGHKFTQVGLITEPEGGLSWFVYSEVPVTCLRGIPTWWSVDLWWFMGCKGNAGDLVTLGAIHLVELVTYGQGYWIARVYNSYGIATDVAQFTSNILITYDVTAVMEEAYSDANDPYLLGSFYFWHPHYMLWGTGFQEWPVSPDTTTNHLYATDARSQNTFCPQHYGATLDINNDPRFWFAGTGGTICNYTLFPQPYKNYLPEVIKTY